MAAKKSKKPVRKPARKASKRAAKKTATRVTAALKSGPPAVHANAIEERYATRHSAHLHGVVHTEDGTKPVAPAKPAKPARKTRKDAGTERELTQIIGRLSRDGTDLASKLDALKNRIMELPWIEDDNSDLENTLTEMINLTTQTIAENLDQIKTYDARVRMEEDPGVKG